MLKKLKDILITKRQKITMKIKKFTGKSLENLRQTIHNNLGSDAVIISSNKNRLLQRHEIIVAYNDHTQQINFQNESRKHAENEKISKLLINLHENWRSKIFNKLNQKTYKINNFYIQEVAQNLKKLLKIEHGINFEAIREKKGHQHAPYVFVFVGATGVGKTTTLAKLAAKAVLQHNLNVGLITTDTYRVAAVDQLKEYSSLLGLEMQIAFSGNELNRHLQNFKQKDVIFIDTPGRSPFDKDGLDDIAEQLGSSLDHNCNTFLIIPANIRREESIEIINNYKELNPSALIISKTDECSKCDGLSTLLDCSQLPVAYISDGQNVPEDIHEASSNLLSSLLLQNYSTLNNTDSIRIGVNGYE